MTNPPHYKLLRWAFEETLSALGEHAKKAIIDDLESRRTSHDGQYLEVTDVCESLERYFGEVSPERTVNRVWMKVSMLDLAAGLTLPNRVALA